MHPVFRRKRARFEAAAVQVDNESAEGRLASDHQVLDIEVGVFDARVVERSQGLSTGREGLAAIAPLDLS
jgi:hypothetical protein